MSERQIKLVYVTQDKKWKLHIQWGNVNRKGTYFTTEYDINKLYDSYDAAVWAMNNYLMNVEIVRDREKCVNDIKQNGLYEQHNNPAKPVSDLASDVFYNKRVYHNPNVADITGTYDKDKPLKIE